jgi:hypothetical protein
VKSLRRFCGFVEEATRRVASCQANVMPVLRSHARLRQKRSGGDAKCLYDVSFPGDPFSVLNGRIALVVRKDECFLASAESIIPEGSIAVGASHRSGVEYRQEGSLRKAFHVGDLAGTKIQQRETAKMRTDNSLNELPNREEMSLQSTAILWRGLIPASRSKLGQSFSSGSLGNNTEAMKWTRQRPARMAVDRASPVVNRVLRRSFSWVD